MAVASHRELSIFVDESGVFGSVQKHSPFYVVSLVLHDQQVSIATQVERLEENISQLGFARSQVIHTAPLVRREEDFSTVDIRIRRTLFRVMANFLRASGVMQKSWVFDKREIEDTDQLVAVIANAIGRFLRENTAYFVQWDRIIVYYDNGQQELTRIINTAFSAIYSNVEVRRVVASRYRLFQAADLCCTLSLIRHKIDTVGLSRSERDFFGTRKDSAERALRRYYFKVLDSISFNPSS